MPATVVAVGPTQQGSHPHGEEGEKEICQAQEQGQIEGKDEEARPEEIGKARNQEEGRSEESVQAHRKEGHETEEAACGTQGQTESRARPASSTGTGCSTSGSDAHTRARAGPGALADDRRPVDGHVGRHERLSGSAPTGRPKR